MNFKRLFQPITLNQMTLKNRLVMTAMHLLYTEDGSVNQRTKDFYLARARGGVGMIIAGGAAADPYIGYSHMLRMDQDRFIPGWKDLADAVHACDCKLCLQFLTPGRYGRAAFVEGDDNVLSASDVYAKMTGSTPRPMTKEDIRLIQERYAQAALRCKQAGIDAVEITAGSGYLICQFLSPVTNKRTDEYGGSFDNRCRFGVELIQAVRDAVGPDYPVLVRVAGNDFVAGGCTNEDCVAFCKKLEQVGVDMLDVTGGWHETAIPQLPGDVPRGGYVYLAQAVKDAVSIPVLSANRHNDPVEAETVLAMEQCDLVGLCRTLVADPDWPNKAAAGALKEIRRCVACNQGCLAHVFNNEPMECLINGFAGREALLKEDKVAVPKQLLVIGGGPAGCEFAYRAAARGHSVTLWEKSAAIGGQLDLVAAPPAKEEFRNLPVFYQAMLEKYGVHVELEREATAEAVEQGGFDAVILATGSTPKEMQLPGSIPVCTAADILRRKEIAGRNVVILGGGTVGCETAAYLAQEGALSPEKLYFMETQQSESPEKISQLLNHSRRNITLVARGKIGANFDFGCAWPLMKDLRRLGVRQLPRTQLVTVTDREVVVAITDRKTGEVKEERLPCDTIVTAVGSVSDDALYQALKDGPVPVYCIGDAREVGKITGAIRQADDLAMEL
ncbi:MAG: FAD-dependent oxidoreductase [Candidatus Onthomonas sp.]|nr:FAD-dependent oxidoreductase [Candidatus Onthomonas sp.]